MCRHFYFFSDYLHLNIFVISNLLMEPSEIYFIGSTDYRLLKFLSVREWTYSQVIADKLKLSRGTIFPHLEKLVKKGFVQREYRRSPHGGRPRVYFKISKKGIELLSFLESP